MEYNSKTLTMRILESLLWLPERVQNEQSFNFQAIIVYIYFVIGSSSEHVGEELSRTHDSNSTYIH